MISFDAKPSNNRGGQEKSLYDIIRTLAHKTYTIDLAYQEDGNLLSHYQENGIQLKKIRATHLTDKTKFSSYRNLLVSYNTLKHTSYDIAYVNELIDIPLASRLKKKGKVKKLVCHLRLAPPNFQILKKKNQISYSIDQVDLFFVATQKMKSLYVDFGLKEEKIVIVPNCFDFTQAAAEAKSEASHVIGYVGRIAEEKGISDLIEVVNANPSYNLLIAGHPQNKEQHKYLAKIKILALDKSRIQFLGHVQDLKSFFEKIDLCIFPSTCEEAFGRVLVESIIHSTPVIGRDVGSVKEILNDLHGLRTFNDTADLDKKIDAHFKTPEEYGLAELSRLMRSKYDLNTIVDQIDAEFKSLLGE